MPQNLVTHPLHLGLGATAIPQPAWVILLTFVTVGAGLAFPYVSLSFVPALRRFLPRPGTTLCKLCSGRQRIPLTVDGDRRRRRKPPQAQRNVPTHPTTR